MQVVSAMRHVLRFRPKGCCFGGFLKGNNDDFHLKEQLRLADGIHHDLCSKVLKEILGMTPGWRTQLRRDVK